MIERILFLLTEHKMTAKELTIKLGINSTTVTEWKSGRMKPTLDIIIKISRLFGVRLDWLINGEGEMYIEYDAEGSPVPQKGQVVFTAKAYGGKTETIILSEDDYEASKPLLERMRQQYKAEQESSIKKRKS